METYAIHDHLGHIVSVAIVAPTKEIRGGPLVPPGCSMTPIKTPEQLNPEDSASVESFIHDYQINVRNGQLVRAKA